MISVDLRTMWQEGGWQGKSIGRILTNEVLRQWRSEIRGIVLDLACGREPSYWRVLGLKSNNKVRLVGVDYNITFCPTVVTDPTRPLQFKNEVAGTVILLILSLYRVDWEVYKSICSKEEGQLSLIRV